MKKVWQKTPAWIRAILLTIVLFYPISIINQTMIKYSLLLFPTYAFLALLFVVGMLFLYWKLVDKWNPFKTEEDVKLSLGFNLLNASNIASIVGLCFLTVSCIGLAYSLLQVDASGSNQSQFFAPIFKAPSITAMPLLLAISLNAGVVEEIAFRGFVQNTTNRTYSRVVSYVLIGVIFSLMHMLPLQLFIPYIIVSVGFSVIADRQKSLGLVVFAHVLVDFILLSMQHLNPAFSRSNIGSMGIGILLVMLISAIFLIVGWKPKKKPVLA